MEMREILEHPLRFVGTCPVRIKKDLASFAVYLPNASHDLSRFLSHNKIKPTMLSYLFGFFDERELQERFPAGSIPVVLECPGATRQKDKALHGSLTQVMGCGI
jgi:hypothetical protein